MIRKDDRKTTHPDTPPKRGLTTPAYPPMSPLGKGGIKEGSRRGAETTKIKCPATGLPINVEMCLVRKHRRMPECRRCEEAA